MAKRSGMVLTGVSTAAKASGDVRQTPRQTADDASVVEKLFRNRRRLVLTFIWRLLPEAQRADVQDLEQEVWLRVLSAALPADPALNAWLFKVTRNLVRDRWRYIGRREGRGIRVAILRSEEDETPGAVDIRDTSPTPEDALQIGRATRDALECLSLPQRELVTMRHLLGLSIADIAAELGMTKVRVMRELARAASLVRARVKEQRR